MGKSFLTASAIVTSIFFISSADIQAQTDSAQSTNDTASSQIGTAIIKPKTVGGAEMLSTNNIIENISRSKDHATLVKAIQAAGLEPTLQEPGPYTLFAPHEEAFAKLPAGMLDSLLMPEKKTELTGVLSYHVVPGKLTRRELAIAVSKGNGKAELTTVSGGTLYLSINADRNLEVADENGNIALVTIFDANQSNGVVQVINNVLMPKAKLE